MPSSADESIDEVYDQPAIKVDVKDKTYTLPRALTRIGHSNFMQIGKLARSRIDLDDGPSEQVYCTLMPVVKYLTTHTQVLS